MATEDSPIYFRSDDEPGGRLPDHQTQKSSDMKSYYQSEATESSRTQYIETISLNIHSQYIYFVGTEYTTIIKYIYTTE